jgi:transposase InsO family protein
VERTPVECRNEVVALFRLMGPHVGAPILEAYFPEMPRRELEDMVRRLKFLYATKSRLLFWTLHWLKPGTAWAIDHCTPPAPVEGTFSQILSVRDLAAQAQLAWTPVPDGSALHVRFVLETLIAEHGAPLLLKKDNGSALNDAGVNRLLAQNGIIGLLSPPATPSYNGGCEAGNGSLRTRTSYEAARHGRAGRWTCDDCEAARLQAFRTARPWGVRGQTPEEVWSKREPITAELRQQFQNAVAFYQEHERKKKAFLPGIELEPGVRASINRAAVRRALQACRLLDVRRGELSLPITS